MTDTVQCCMWKEKMLLTPGRIAAVMHSSYWGTDKLNKIKNKCRFKTKYPLRLDAVPLRDELLQGLMGNLST